MAINTSGYAVNGSIPTLIGPTTKPVVFNYQPGATLAPTSGGAAYATGMASMGQSLGGALQEAAQNLNANTIAKNQAARAQAQMQAQITPMQQALMQAQMARDTGQANYFTGIWGQQNQAQQQLLAQRAAQQAQAQQSVQGSPMPGTQSSNAPTSPMPPPQSNGLIGLNPANAGLVQAANNPNSYSVNSSLGAMPSSIGVIQPDLAGTGLKYDQNSIDAQRMAVQNTNVDANKAQDTFNNHPVVQNYEDAAKNANILMQYKQQIEKNGQPLNNAQAGNLINSYAALVDPSKAKQNVPAATIISEAPYQQKFDPELARFTSKDGNTMFSNQTALDAINTGLSQFGNMTNEYRALQMTGIAQARNTNIDTPQQLAKIYPDKPSMAAQQYKWTQPQKQSAQPSANRDQLKSTVATIIQKHPDWNPAQVKQAAASGQY